MSAGHPAEVETLFGDYPLDQAFDEMRERNGDVRAHYRALVETLVNLPQDELQRCKQSAELSFLTQGITFTVYGREEGTERIFPYDLVPRLVTAPPGHRSGVGPHRAWTHAAHHGTQSLPARRLLRRKDSF